VCVGVCVRVSILGELCAKKVTTTTGSDVQVVKAPPPTPRGGVCVCGAVSNFKAE